MQTLFFDLDDTILRYDSVADRAWEEACEKYIKYFSRISTKELKEAILESSTWYWSDPVRHQKGRLNLKKARRDVVKATFQKLKENNLKSNPTEISNEIADHFSVRREELMEPFPRAIETLQTLKKRGTRMALLTNGEKQSQQNKIDRYDLEKYFDIILIEGALGFGKPDERVFKKALSHFKIKPSEAQMIGDNLEADIYGAQQLGIKAVWNDWARAGLPQSAPAVPDRTISRIAELI
ncbi:HAD-IA family hydrolase [Patescibacteria group bacterium]|nr:HAD-IA family hydrolase [Patescibacteria group bacterium]MBU1703637.1 HAD-IA family hydrolase [Patescibacteria group bacterium]MBU1954210.1 HAD-IA family hydrolase [Patescibacteria group bacterium]